MTPLPRPSPLPMADSHEARIAALPCWQGEIRIEPLAGGMTNLNYRVRDSAIDAVVRLGEDDLRHLISRGNEVAAQQAAHAAGVSPAVLHHEPGILVIEYVDGQVCTEADVRDPARLPRIVDTIKTLHRQAPRHFAGVPVLFWVFQVLRHYRNLLDGGGSHHREKLDRLMPIAAELEQIIGPVDIVLAHNDLLPANLIDDGEKIWLIDYDYAGFNSPLFDLANLASNNEFDAEQASALLETYFEKTPDEHLLQRFDAMTCASLLRETLWSMVSELGSRVAMDFAGYTAQNLARFERAWTSYEARYPRPDAAN